MAHSHGLFRWYAYYRVLLPGALIGLALTFFGVPPGRAQAPASIAGKVFGIAVSDGEFPFADDGYFIFAPADTGTSFRIIGLDIVDDSSGTYSYTRPSAATGSITLNDGSQFDVHATADFLDLDSGDYQATRAGAFQTGQFEMFSGSLPASIAGKRFFCVISDGAFPYADNGSFEFLPAATGSSYSVIGVSVAQNSSGTYSSYTKLNASLGRILINDVSSGRAEAYFAFSAATTGAFAVRNGEGFQFGSFIMSNPDLTRPTISITSPANGKSYTNSQTVPIIANASDNIGVTSVIFYDGAVSRGSDTTSPFTFDWRFSAADNGAHVWRAYAYDAAGNVSVSAQITLTVSIDSGSPTITITSPSTGQSFSNSSVTIRGTAADPGSPSSGLSAVEVRTNGGNWQSATGTANWNRALTLSPCANLIEARSRDKAGNYSNTNSIQLTYTGSNNSPTMPVNLSPENGGVNISLTPVLQASGFSDADCGGDTHVASQWQVLLSSSGTTIVWDSGTNATDKTSIVVPSGKLGYGTTNRWRVRYRDSRGAWSSYSSETLFVTDLPIITVRRQGQNVIIVWPSSSAAFHLESCTDLFRPNWLPFSAPGVELNGQIIVSDTMTGQNKFYRIRR